jgi:hypothetical protein
LLEVCIPKELELKLIFEFKHVFHFLRDQFLAIIQDTVIVCVATRQRILTQLIRNENFYSLFEI